LKTNHQNMGNSSSSRRARAKSKTKTDFSRNQYISQSLPASPRVSPRMHSLSLMEAPPAFPSTGLGNSRNFGLTPPGSPRHASKHKKHSRTVSGRSLKRQVSRNGLSRTLSVRNSAQFDINDEEDKPCAMDTKDQMRCILRFWVRTECIHTSKTRKLLGDNSASNQNVNQAKDNKKLPREVVTLIIDHFMFQSIFATEHREKVKNFKAYLPAKIFEHYDYEFRFSLLGNSMVGKSAFLCRYIDDTYKSAYVRTMGYDSGQKMIEMDGFKIRLKIWDWAPGFFENNKAMFDGEPHGILFMFDITKSETFKCLARWNNLVGYEPNPSYIKKILVGNKCDLQQRRHVRFDSVRGLCNELDIDGYVETSAKTGFNIDTAMNILVKELLAAYQRKTMPFYG